MFLAARLRRPASPDKVEASRRRNVRPGRRRLIALLVVLSVLPILVLTVAAIGFDFHRTQGRSARDLQSIAALMAADIRSELHAQRIQLMRIADMFGTRPAGELRQSTAVQQQLAAMAANLPGTMALSLFDAHADLIASSRPTPDPTNVAGRTYFQALRQRQSDLQIGRLAWNPEAGAFSFAVNRRLRPQSHQFSGIVQSAVSAQPVLTLQAQLDHHQDTTIALIRSDGAMVLCAPLPPLGRTPPPLPATSELLHTLFGDQRAGLLRLDSATGGAAPGPLGRRPALAAFQQLSGYPLALLVARPRQAILAPWRRRSYQRSALAAVMLMIAALLGRSALRSSSREAAINRQLADQADRLARALTDKELLFRELHHRIKNNLQMIGSMLALQAAAVRDQAARQALDDALDRVATIALIHQALQEDGDSSEIDIASYLQDLAHRLTRSGGGTSRGIAIEVRATSATIEHERAVPLALIVTEAVTNALKHAFPEGRTGRILIQFDHIDDTGCLTVADDGIGLASPDPDGQEGRLGTQLMAALAGQLDGRIALSTEAGRRLEIRFPLHPARSPPA